MDKIKVVKHCSNLINTNFGLQVSEKLLKIEEQKRGKLPQSITKQNYDLWLEIENLAKDAKKEIEKLEKHFQDEEQ